MRDASVGDSGRHVRHGGRSEGPSEYCGEASGRQIFFGARRELQAAAFHGDLVGASSQSDTAQGGRCSAGGLLRWSWFGEGGARGGRSWARALKVVMFRWLEVTVIWWISLELSVVQRLAPEMVVAWR